MTHPKTQKDNGMAIASLVLGIVSFAGPGPLTGIPAIIFGFVGLKNPHNRGLAIAGIILGSLTVLFALFILFFLLLIFVLAVVSASSDPEPVPLYESGTPSATHQQI